ncbi:MAG: hypothetical protein HGA81_06300, partial [Chlorobium limicola]|nr:hypothetical protein [Chlorobium limicola]
MYNRLKGLFILGALLLHFLPLDTALALDVPPLRGRVNDNAAMISSQVEAGLDAKLAELEKTESTQIVILTVPSLEGDALEDFSMKVVEAWKIG